MAEVRYNSYGKACYVISCGFRRSAPCVAHISYIKISFSREVTITFTLGSNDEREMKMILSAFYEALSEKGYNPVHQIVGYILSGDPTYITNHKNARSLICRIDRDELMSALVRTYLGIDRK